MLTHFRASFRVTHVISRQRGFIGDFAVLRHIDTNGRSLRDLVKYVKELSSILVI